jgi:CBS domain-containing protein
MTASAGVAAAAHLELGAAVRSETGRAQAAIVIVGHDPGVREVLCRELSTRYGADYQIVLCYRPAELAPWMRDLRAAGLPVALVIGGVGGQHGDGIEVLSAVRAIDPTALRVAAVGWGDRDAVPAVTTTTTIRDTATIMTTRHFRHLPVACDTGLLGLVDITDVWRALLAAERGSLRDPRCSKLLTEVIGPDCDKLARRDAAAVSHVQPVKQDA